MKRAQFLSGLASAEDMAAMVSDDRAEHNHSAITDSPESWISADVFSISSPPELLSAPAPVFDLAPPPAHPAGGPQWEFSILAEHDPAGGAQWQNSKPASSTPYQEGERETGQEGDRTRGSEGARERGSEGEGETERETAGGTHELSASGTAASR